MSNETITTIVYKRNIPDHVITKICNMLGDRFINVEKQNGKWQLTFIKVPEKTTKEKVVTK